MRIGRGRHRIARNSHRLLELLQFEHDDVLVVAEAEPDVLDHPGLKPFHFRIDLEEAGLER